MKKKRALIYIVTGLLLIYFVVIMITQQVKIGERGDTIEALEAEIEEVREEIGKLEKEIENAESRETIERIAREELGLVHPGDLTFYDTNG